MKLRRLGLSGIEIAPLALGGNVFGWTVDEPTSFKLLNGFLAAGFNFVDTADIYSKWVPGHKGGESELILGSWMKDRANRKGVIIATKCGMEMGPGKKGLSKAYVLAAAEDSLRRLRTDYIDLYQAHSDDPLTPMEETFEAFDQLIKQGKVRAIGASNFTGPRLAEAAELSKSRGFPAYQSLQPQYNLYDREDYEKNLEPVCQKYGIGVITYFSLASGFLSGKYRSEADLSKSPRGQGVKKYLTDRGFRILAGLSQVAERYHSTFARVALAWLIARPSITAPIASATTLEQLNDLVEATKLDLDAAAIALLNKASA